MDAAHETIETQRSSHIKGSDKRVSLPDKDVTSIPPLTTPVTMRSVQKKPVHYIDNIGAELVRGRVC